MKQKTVTLKNGQVSYLKFGQGSDILIAVHGHGDSARTFSVLAPALEKRFTVYAIDLPFHGKTTWEAPFFSKTDLGELFESICFLEKKSAFTVMGFSFGTRALLALLPFFAERYKQLILIAPDGICTPSLRKMFLAPKWLRRALQKALIKPNWLLRPSRFLFKYGLFPKQSMRFLENNLTRPHRIERAFGMWHSIDDFKTKNSTSINYINKNSLPVSIISAKNDPFIEYSVLEDFAENIPTAQLFPFSEGHWIVDEKLCSFLKKQYQ